MEGRARILVVDDELPVCRSVSAALEKDYLVDTALSAEEAIRMGRERDYDVVITDLMMPGLSGMDLLRRTAEVRPNTKVIMITGYPSIRSAVESMRHGAFDYIPKPFTPDELRSVVSRSLESRLYKAGATGVREPVTPPPEGIYRIPGNSWAHVLEDGTVRIGADHVLISTIPGVEALELPGEGEMRYQGEACVRLRDSRGFTHKVWSPISGRVVSANTALREDLHSLERDPYGQGWLVLLSPTNLDSEILNLSSSKSG